MTPAQAALVVTHQPRVQGLAWSVRRQLPPSVEMDDLVSDGYVGLVQAALSFDPARGWKFWTFASHKVYFAMIDGLRQDHGKRNYILSGDRQRPFVMPIGECYRADGSPKGDVMRSFIDPAPSPEALAQDAEERRRLAAAAATLPAREARILYLHSEGHTLAAIAPLLGVGEARVSQLRKRALAKIREVLAA